MKKLFFQLSIVSLLLFNNAIAQVSSGTGEVNKALKKAVYGGSVVLSNGNVVMFFQEKGELVGYEFGPDAKYIATHQGGEATNLLNGGVDKVSADPRTSAAPEIASGYALDVMYPIDSWGSLKLGSGKIHLNSTEKFIDGFELEQLEKRKLKIEGTWKTISYGARAIIPNDKTLYLFKAQNGRKMSFDFNKLKRNPMVPRGGFIQTAGVITEKISLRDPSPYNSNRLVVFKVGFDEEETSNIHIMPYAMQGLGVGTDAQGNMTVLTMPLNAPSTVAAQKALNAKDEERSNLYIYRFDSNNNLVDEHKIKSDILTVNYQALPVGNKTFIIGTGTSDGKNYRNAYAGRKLDAFSISVMDENGNLSPFKTSLDEEFSKKVEEHGDKANLKFLDGPQFYDARVLDNGNVFLLAKSTQHHMGALVTPTGELLKFYIFPHLDWAKNTFYSEQLEVKGNKVFVVITDQPHELTNEKQTSTGSSSSTTYMGGGTSLRTTTTYTETKQLFEIFHLSNVFIIDGNNASSKKIDLNKEVEDFFTLGNIPVVFADNGIYIPGRIKANRGKEVSLIKIDY